MALIGEANSGAYSRADVDRKRRLAEMLMKDDFQAREPFGALAKGLTGARAGFEEGQAAQGEKQGNQIMAGLLKGKDWQGVMGSEWATPQNLAMASMLQGREWNQQDQQANWAHEDANRSSDRAWERGLMDTKRGWELSDVQSERDYNSPLRDAQLEGANLTNETNQFGLDQAREGFKTLVTPEERSQYGISPGDKTPWQLGPDGRLYDFGKGAGVTVNTGDTADGALNKALSTKEGESWAAVKDAGMVAGAMSQDLGLLDELIKVAPQGPIIGPLAETFKGFSSAGDAFQSVVKRVAPSLRTPGSGATSDIEYQGFLDGLPALKNAPEANVLINSVMKSKAAINKKRSDVVTSYQNGDMTIGDARRAMADLNNTSILTPEMRQALAGVGAGEPSAAPEVGAVVEGFVYEGGDPSLQSSWRKM